MSLTMQINALIDVSLLLSRMADLDLSGIDATARACGVAPSTVKKLLRGEFPKIVALRRVCAGLQIDQRELVISASTLKKTSGSGRRVLPGRWPADKVAGHDG